MRSEMIVHPDEVTKKKIDHLADVGVTVLGIHPVGGKNAASSLRELVARLETEEYRSLLDYARSRGLEIEYEFHAAGYLMPRELFSEHPEYFRMNASGERTPDFNFCVSNPDALRLFADRARELASVLYQSRPYFYFWMDDKKDSRCHCPRCRGLSASDQQLIAVNEMAKAIRTEIPDAKVAYLAYMDTILLPETIRAEKGVFLEYAPFEKYTAAARSENAAMLIEREKRMLRPLFDFFGHEDAKVLEYWYDNSLFSGWKKPPARFTLEEGKMLRDIEEYRDMGFLSIATFACFLGPDYEALYGEVDHAPFARGVRGKNAES